MTFRVGRWKGENVATSEVADILTMAPCILEANVYGVQVEGETVKSKERDPPVSPHLRPITQNPFSLLSLGHEGRIGMAAVVLKEGQELDCSHVYQQVLNYLPAYARPRFIRIQVRRDLCHPLFGVRGPNLKRIVG